MSYINLNIDFDYEDYQPESYDQGLKNFFSTVIQSVNLNDASGLREAAIEVSSACSGFIEDKRYLDRTVMFDPNKFSKGSAFPVVLTRLLNDHDLKVLTPSRLHIAGRDRLVGLLRTKTQ